MNLSQAQINSNTGSRGLNQIVEDQELAAKNSDIQDEAWFPNSGATHHVTSKLHNLNLGGAAYQGKNYVYMGNGAPIHITHVGDACVESTKKNRQLLLKNLLRVPQIKKNLMSVSQFARDNEYFSNFTLKFVWSKTKN